MMLKIGDRVSVNFHNSKYTLGQDLELINIPCATGESWIVKDHNERLHYISEGCTVSGLSNKGSNEDE